MMMGCLISVGDADGLVVDDRLVYDNGVVDDDGLVMM